MASPFNVFRKHQRAMMAVIGVLCMIAFSIGSVTWNMLGDSRSPKNPVVVSINGHPVHESELHVMIQQRGLANRFVAECMVAAFGSSQSAQFAAYQLTGNFEYEQRFGEPTEASVVRTRVLAQRAEQLGIRISDDVINEFLKKRVTLDRLDRNAYSTIVKRLDTGAQQVFNALRTELAANRLFEISFTRHTTPAQRWEYYRRVKEKATVEVLPVKVEEFVAQVADPDEETLARFFEQYKEQEPLPDSPEPGFKTPKKAVFQLFKADYDKFYDESSVTDEEIKEHYEQYKDQRYRQMSFGDLDKAEDAGKDKAAADQPDGEEKPADEKPADEPASEKPLDEKPADEKPSAEKPADDKPADEEPAGEEPNDEKPADEKPADEQSPEQDAGDKQSSAVPNGYGPHVADRRQTFCDLPTGELALAAFDDEPARSATAAGAAVQPDSEQPTAEQPAETPAAEDKPADAASSDEPKSDDEKPASAQEPAAGADEVQEKESAGDSPPKYEPLSKVEASIRKELAGQKAAEKMQQELQAVQAKMLRFKRNLGPEDTKPVPPDLSQTARDHGLTETTTRLLSRFEFKDQYPDLAAAERGMFLEMAYGTLPLFQSSIVRDLPGNRYLFWKIDEEEARVPDLSEVRGEVVEAWKRIQARDLALKEAEKLADKARRAKKTLAEVFGADSSREVTKTRPFAWLSPATANSLDTQTPPVLSTVPEVPGAGEDFMRAIFNLDVGGVGVAMNAPKTVAYVVRVEKYSPSPDLLHITFMADEFRGYASVSAQDSRRLFDDWIKEIENEAQLTWLRPADQRMR